MSAPPPPLVLDTSSPPIVPLVAGEQLLHCHQVEYADRVGLAWLTSQRVLLRADRPTPLLQAKISAATTSPEERANMQQPQQFTLPLASIAGHKVSAATAAKVMLMIQYVGHAQTVQRVVLNFVSPTAAEDRARWKEVLGELAPATAPPQQEIRVKPEPGLEPAAAAAAPSPAVSALPPSNFSSTAPAVQPARPTAHPVLPPIPVVSQAAAAAASTAATPARPHAAAPHAGAAPHAAAASAAKPAAPAAPAAARTPHAGVKRPHGATAPTGAAGAAHSHHHPHGGGALSSADMQSLIQSRAALLARDASLKQLHSELVPKAVSEEEFWGSHARAELLREEQMRQNLPLVGPGGPAQRAGISSAMAGAIKPETGCNVVRYTLDATQIHAIFLENPTVHDLYMQLVPTQLSEKEFWTKYFRSQYVHSQANASTSAQLERHPAQDDIFARARAMQEARESEQLGMAHSAALNNASAAEAAAARALLEQEKDVATKATLLARRVDPSVDLTAADMSEAVLGADPTKSSGGSSLGPLSNVARSRKARAQTELLQRYNRHGMLVLDSNLHTPHATHHARNASTSVSGSGHGESGLAPAETTLQQKYHAGLARSLELTDLEREVPPVYNELPISAGRGFFAPSSISTAGNGATSGRKDAHAPADGSGAQQAHAAESARLFRSELASWSCVATPAAPHSVQHVPDSASSLALVLQLTATARGMNKAAIAAKQLREEGTGQQLVVFSMGDEPDMVIPDQFRDELKKRYHTCTELFRHFWSSLNPRMAPKLRRVHAALDEQYGLLQLIRSSLNQRSFSALVPVLNPLIGSIEKCQSTFTAWEEKENKRLAAVAGHRRGVSAAGGAVRPAGSPPLTSPHTARSASPSPPPLDDGDRDSKRLRT